MSYFFAKIVFVKTLEDIPVKFNFMKNEKIFLWYIKKFNPYIVDEIKICGKEGFQISLPFTKEIWQSFPQMADYLMERIFEELEFNRVNIVSTPYDYKTNELPHSKLPGIGLLPFSASPIQPNKNIKITVANGKEILMFYLLETMKKALKSLDKTVQKSEVTLIAGNEKKLNAILNIIEDELNFFNIIDTENEFDYYKEKTKDIYSKTGLNILIFNAIATKGVLSTSDVIINVREDIGTDSFIYKSGAIFIDLSNSSENAKNLAKDRRDILVIDGISLKYDGEFIKSTDFDMVFHTLSRYYRTYKEIDHDVKYFELVKQELKTLNVKLSSLCLGEKILNKGSYLLVNKMIK